MKISTGILPYRHNKGSLEVFLIHPGGPFWTNKDNHSWSIAKGEVEENETLLEGALREFFEETGFSISNELVSLGYVNQSKYKTVYAWAVEESFDTDLVKSNLFEMEWPLNSGIMKEFPEVDRAQWFSLDEARTKMIRGQIPFLDRI